MPGVLPDDTTYVVTDIECDGPWPGPNSMIAFASVAVMQGPDESNRLFDGSGLCLRSYMAAVTGNPVLDTSRATMPDGWLGGVPHTHRAIDDARGYGHLLGVLLARAGATGSG